MRFLGDEMFMLPSLRVLRDAGRETASIKRDSPRATDERVLRRAVREGWIILTFDKDFYRRIYEDRLPAPPGVVQFSMPYPKPREAGERLLELLAGGIQLDGFFTVVARSDFERHPLP